MEKIKERNSNVNKIRYESLSKRRNMIVRLKALIVFLREPLKDGHAEAVCP